MSNDNLLLVWGETKRASATDTVHDVWGVDDDGTVCAFVRMIAHPNYLMLCDIEVRPGWRGNELGISLIRLIEQETQMTMYTSGNFTPKGLRSLSEHLSVLGKEQEPTQPAHRDMTFVQDWDKKFPKYPI